MEKKMASIVKKRDAASENKKDAVKKKRDATKKSVVVVKNRKLDGGVHGGSSSNPNKQLGIAREKPHFHRTLNAFFSRNHQWLHHFSPLYVHDCYTCERYYKTYAATFSPVPELSAWPEASGVLRLFPPVIPPPPPPPSSVVPCKAQRKSTLKTNKRKS
ncbi:unnamed protein product [Brassica rapa]|uniref:Uncharacterized protein n=2 Tax=Brassica TaxID=3705 RepID=A0A3P6AR20_BRACM|nr:unnamed protein product [Brassica rapa]VDC86548.1 unnamed protein product [Brassica rapa]